MHHPMRPPRDTRHPEASLAPSHPKKDSMTTKSEARATRKAEKANDPTRVSFWKFLTWSATGASYAVSVMLLGYFTIYATDSLGLNAGIVAGILVFVKILDALGLLWSGWLIDRAPETRWGKARPFELAIVGVWVASALLFSIPGGLGDVAKYIWIGVAYALISAVFTPLLNSNDPLYLARAFGSRDAITKISSRSGIFVGLFAIVAGIGLPLIFGSAGKDPSAWTIAAWSLAVPMALFGLGRFVFNKEKYLTEDPTTPKVTLKEIWTVLKSNRHLWTIAAIQFVNAFVGFIGVGTYYFRYIVGDLSLLALASAMNILLLPILIFLPVLVRKFGIAKTMFVANLIGAAGFVLFALGGLGMPFVIAALLFSAVAGIPIAFLIPVMIIDSATYNEWQGNRRLESVGGAVTGFGRNIAAAISVGATGLVLTATGYNGTLDVQAPAATAGITVLASWVPAALTVISAFVALGYGKFERQLPTITADIDLRRMEEANGEVPAWATPYMATAATAASGIHIVTEGHTAHGADAGPERSSRDV
ncbi:MFS transporter [Microbacterium rhizosphaerae]|uniref:MFS transporter n=2 Tax=Microbacterium rhizosphaerae TaxID=1678237 RepID=A0ABZ0SNF3_9MICO|nr:MFS transporter [Microbacterium rhizosphaerae]WPR89358.1 MFS transporter [Microbacterium rhizosphaerae]